MPEQGNVSEEEYKRNELLKVRDERKKKEETYKRKMGNVI